MNVIRATAFLLAAGLSLALVASVPAQRVKNADKAKAAAPTAVGKVAAYEADKSITVETKSGRDKKVVKTEFAIVKDKTKIELPAQVKAIEVGMTVSVWADKDNPKQAAKIAAAGGGRPAKEESSDAKKVLDAGGTKVGKLEPKDLGRLLELIKPAGEHELAWKEIPWMTDVAKARQKAAAEGKLLVHWSATPHPLGLC